MESIVIIGGNAAGLTAASRAKRINPKLDITVLERLPQIAYSTCGIPYMLSKVIEAERLISFTPEKFQQERGIRVHNHIEVNAIIPGRKRVEATRKDSGESVTFGFDRLLIATGVKPHIPNIPGSDLKNVFSIISLQDALNVQQHLETVSTIGIIGAGYAGLEFAESLRSLGKTVRIFEREPHVMPTVDSDMAQIIEFELRRFGVEVFTSANVLALVGQQGRVNGIKAASRLGIVPADLVLMDAGVVPNTDLVTDTDIRIGLSGGIAVDDHMETTVPGVFAAGNCAETFCPIRRRPVLNAIGTVAAKQGRIAGENLAGQRSKFLGSVGTTILKVFELGVGRTGLTSREATNERISCVSARIEADDRASYYPGTSRIWIKLIVDRESRKLVGAQAVGYGDIARRIDVTAAAISSGMTIDDLAQLDLAYAPPFGSLWDPLLVAAQAVMRRMD